MKSKSILLILSIFFTFSCGTETNDGDLVKKIKENRNEKDFSFKKRSTSPIVDKDNFKGLNYYPILMDYRVKASLKELNPLAKDGERSYAVTFKLNNKEYNAILLKQGESHLLAFKDLTSSKETYKGGRYLDINVIEGEETWLNFNEAYHPYCVYNDKYTCTIPPKENTFDTKIKAGEKL